MEQDTLYFFARCPSFQQTVLQCNFFAIFKITKFALQQSLDELYKFIYILCSHIHVIRGNYTKCELILYVVVKVNIEILACTLCLFSLSHLDLMKFFSSAETSEMFVMSIWFQILLILI